jgi:hypothetical protein
MEAEMAKKTVSDLDRFFNSVVKVTYGEWECWEWQKYCDEWGYGLFYAKNRRNKPKCMVRVHRWSYEQFVSRIPDGMVIDHLCRNACCVNPQHLEPVTNLENIRRGWTANKIVCKYGHLLSGDNVRIMNSGGRL